MQETAKVMEMAGYCAAHSIWSVSDGETLIPLLGYLAADDSRCIERLAMGPVAALVQGERRLASLADNQLGAVLIKDGRLHLSTDRSGEKTDCLILDVRFSAAPHCRLQYLLPYRSGQHERGFAVHNPVLSECQGFDGEQLEILNEFFFKGLAGHEQGSALWQSHYQPQIDQQQDLAALFTLEELQLLRRAPLLMLEVLAGIERLSDGVLLSGVSALLAEAGGYLNPLLSRLLSPLRQDLPALAAQLQVGGVNAVAELLVIRQVFEAHLSAADSRALALALGALARDIAKLADASRGRQRSLASCLGLDGL